jgi:phosphosulfolactate synthase (CoM biosynthesis protein A)
MMITQHQARKYAKATGFEKLELVDQMIKALTATRKELRDQLVDEGLAEYRESFIDEHMVKAHYRKTFKRL